MTVFTSLKPEGSPRIREVQDAARTNWRARFGVEPVAFAGEPPEFSEVVRRGADAADADGVILYANADVLFGEEVRRVVAWCRAQEEDFLVVGRRTDLLPDGRRVVHRPSGMDYFFFRRGMFRDLPRTVVGRAYYDCALLAHCLRRGIRVIDASDVLEVEHQWHDYGHVAGGRAEVFSGEAAVANKRNNALRDFGPHLADVAWRFVREGDGLKVVPKRVPLLRRLGCRRLWNLLTRGGRPGESC